MQSVAHSASYGACGGTGGCGRTASRRGRSAIKRVRSAPLRLPQAAISLRLRPQPRQKPFAAWIMQTLVQGLSIAMVVSGESLGQDKGRHREGNALQSPRTLAAEAEEFPLAQAGIF